MDLSVKAHHEILRLNTRLFTRCLDGVDDEKARTRINDRTNNIAFLASHLVDARYFFANYLGLKLVNPFKEVLADLRSIEQFTEFPVVREVETAWQEVSPALAGRLGEMTPAELQKPSGQDFPYDDKTVLGGIAFLVQHESYHLGQLGLLRKCFHLPPLRFT
jgi:uncharacterized damage-inducible protein DinB